MQTATEQLMIALYEGGYLRGNGNEIDDILGKYKKVFKQQIEKTFDDAVESEILGKKITAEQYFAETYGSKGSDETKVVEFDHLKKEVTSSQTEISDEEIYKEAEHKSKIFRGWTTYETSAFIMACQWYREQLKKK